MLRISFLFAIVVFFSNMALSQITAVVDDVDLQSWNDLSITVGLSEKVDLYVPFTFRLAGNISRFSEGKIGTGLTFKPTKRFAITTFYQYVRSRNASGAYRYENRYILRGVYKFPTKHFGLSHRSQYEYRDRKGANAWRYRAAITIDKELPERWVKGMKAFITDEVFLESATRRFSRNRFSVGVNKSLNKKLSVDLYYLFQGDNFSHPGSVNVIGTSWKVKL